MYIFGPNKTKITEEKSIYILYFLYIFSSRLSEEIGSTRANDPLVEERRQEKKRRGTEVEEEMVVLEEKRGGKEEERESGQERRRSKKEENIVWNEEGSIPPSFQPRGPVNLPPLRRPPLGKQMKY